MSRKLFLVSVVLVCAVALTITGTSVEASQFKRKFLKMDSGPQAASWYPLGAGMMTLFEKATGISTSNRPGGAESNLRSVERGTADVGFAFSHASYNAYNGLHVFKEPHKRIRHLGSLYWGALQGAVKRDSDIHSWADLYNKRIVPGKAGFTGTSICQTILKAYGITFESIKKNGGRVSFVGHGDSSALMKDGHNDLVAAAVEFPHAIFLELNFRPEIRLLSIDPEHLKKVLEIEPGLFPVTIPKGTYKGIDKDVTAMGFITTLVVRDDLEEEVAYTLVKTIYENLDALKKIKPKAVELIKLETALWGCKIPVHPGAMKYYKEKGVKLQ